MIIMLNNKSNFTRDEYLSYQAKLFSLDRKDCSIVVFPSFTNLALYEDNYIRLGSQNVSAYETGSHTGEVSAEQLKSLGVEYCLIGHSERRSEQGESDLLLRVKILRLMEAGIKVVLCVGETLEEKRNSNSVSKVISQIKSDIDGMNIKYDDLIIAYEPVWAIGTGKVATADDIELVSRAIKDYIPVKVLYGGSVDSNNISSVLTPSVDGFLLGKSSLDTVDLQKLIDNILK